MPMGGTGHHMVTSGVCGSVQSRRLLELVADLRIVTTQAEVQGNLPFDDTKRHDRGRRAVARGRAARRRALDLPALRPDPRLAVGPRRRSGDAARRPGSAAAAVLPELPGAR